MPTIFVFSISLSFARRTATLIRKHLSISTLTRGFNIIGHAEEVVLPAGGAALGDNHATWIGPSASLCGSPFRAVLLGNDSTSIISCKHVTIGGIIRLCGRWYGFTVTHTFR
jgi:hypothetical protein